MARRAGRRGGIIKLYPPPLASQQLPANHQPHFMKGGRGGEGRERKERRRGKRERQGGQRKGRGGEKEERWWENGERGREMGWLEEGGNEGEQVREFKAEKERRGWREDEWRRMLDSCSASSSLHSTSPGLNSHLRILPDWWGDGGASAAFSEWFKSHLLSLRFIVDFSFS